MAINHGIDERAQLQRRLVWRIAIAIALIVAAVIGLEVLDRYAKPKPAPKRDVTVEVKPAPRLEAVAEVPKPEPKPEPAAEPPKPEAEAPPAVPATPEAPPPPVVERTPSTTAPRADAAEDAKPPVRAARPPEPPARPAAPAAKPEAVPPPPAPAPTQAKAPAVAEPPAKPALAPAPAAGARGFAVQLGVFSTVENAQDLQARLKANGIPSYSETRVQVGPFKDRAEAEKAREKLRAMGMTPLIIPLN